MKRAFRKRKERKKKPRAGVMLSLCSSGIGGRSGNAKNPIHYSYKSWRRRSHNYATTAPGGGEREREGGSRKCQPPAPSTPPPPPPPPPQPRHLGASRKSLEKTGEGGRGEGKEGEGELQCVRPSVRITYTRPDPIPTPAAAARAATAARSVQPRADTIDEGGKKVDFFPFLFLSLLAVGGGFYSILYFMLSTPIRTSFLLLGIDGGGVIRILRLGCIIGAKNGWRE